MSVLLVHGAWHGAWCWEPLIDALGGDAAALDLPSDHVAGAGFTDDVNAVRDVLDDMTDVVLVGHSYGGAVISEAGAHDNVAHLVYLCAFTLDVGESLLANAAPRVETALNAGLRPDGDLITVTPEAAGVAFYGDVADAPVDRLVPHNMRAFTTELAAAAWRDKPSTYVLCTQDQAIHPDRQRFYASRCSSVVELEASHSPMLSVPDRVAEIIRGATT
jgi:pimeloyl-ACP methyl ester carboxylesterase